MGGFEAKENFLKVRKPLFRILCRLGESVDPVSLWNFDAESSFSSRFFACDFTKDDNYNSTYLVEVICVLSTVKKVKKYVT